MLSGGPRRTRTSCCSHWLTLQFHELQLRLSDSQPPYLMKSLIASSSSIHKPELFDYFRTCRGQHTLVAESVPTREERCVILVKISLYSVRLITVKDKLNNKSMVSDDSTMDNHGSFSMPIQTLVVPCSTHQIS